MIGVTYPGIDTEKRALTDILAIDMGDTHDSIYLGQDREILLGFIGLEDKYFEFAPQTTIEEPFPKRSSYQACLADVFTYIVNDLDLCIELAVLTHRKTTKESK